jgi:hypothetical protein
MNCNDLNIEPCKYCDKYYGEVFSRCVVSSLSMTFELYPEYENRKKILINYLKSIPIEDPNYTTEEVLRCVSALIKVRYKELEHLLVLV